MKAVNYQGAFKVKVEDVPKPKIEHPDDVVVKVTTAGECQPCIALPSLQWFSTVCSACNHITDTPVM